MITDDLSDRDKRDLLVYTGGTLVAAVIVGVMFRIAWVNGAHRIALVVANATLLPDGTAGAQAVVLFAVGVFLGLLFVFANDYRKRYQGIPVLVGSLGIAVVFVLGGLGVNFGLTPLNAGAVAAGLAVAVATELVDVGGTPLTGELRDIDLGRSRFGVAVNTRGKPLEFTVAAAALKLYSIGAVGLGAVANLVFAGSDLGPFHFVFTAVSLGTIYFLIGFIDIEVTPAADETRFEVLGTKQSGKTYLALGLFLSADDRGDIGIANWDGDMPKLLEKYDRAVQRHLIGKQRLNWNIDGNARDEFGKYNFDLKTGQIKERVFYCRVVDYPGELIEDIRDRFVGDDASNDSPSLATDGGDVPEDPADDDQFDTTENPVSADEDYDVEEILGIEDGDVDSEDPTVIDESDPVDAPTGAATNPGENTPFGRVENDSRGDPAATHTNQDDDPDGPHTSNPGRSVDERSRSDAPDQRSSQPAEQDPTERGIQTVVENIAESDKLIVIVDGHRFVGGEPTGKGSGGMASNEMKDIVKHADVDEVIPVVTKADFLVDRFKRSPRSDGADPRVGENWDAFREFVSEELSESRRTSPFMDSIDANLVYPVFFHTEERLVEEVESSTMIDRSDRYPDHPETEAQHPSAGAPDDDPESRASDEGDQTVIMPAPDEDGELQPEGYDPLLDAIID